MVEDKNKNNMSNNLKKGDNVIVFDRYNPLVKFKEDVITSSGTKYIFVYGYNGLKFYKDTLCSEYMGLEIFPGTKEEFFKYIENETKKLEFVRQIEHKLRNLSYDKILKIKEIVDEQ